MGEGGNGSSELRVLSFDCYGTLIDWESGILAALAGWRARLPAGVADDALLTAFGEAEGGQQVATPTMRYSDVLAEVARQLAQRFKTPIGDAEAAAFGASVPDWPAFDDTAAALARLKGHFWLVILSNVDDASFAGTQERLGTHFDAVLTAELIGSYKPDPRNFAYLRGYLHAHDFHGSTHLHVAESLHHDHLPAKQAGMRTAWIHRRHAKGGFGATRAPDAEIVPDMRFESVAELADKLGA